MFQYDRPNPSKASGSPSFESRYADRGVALPPRPEFSFGVTDLVMALWKRKLLLIALPILGAALAAGASMFLDTTYRATTQILIDPRDVKVLSNDVNPGGVSGDTTTAFVDSQARIITSLDLVRRVVREENLAQDPDYNERPGRLDRLLGTEPSSSDPEIAIAEQIYRQLKVERGEKTFIIDITMEASSPEKAARLANKFASAFLEDQTRSRGAVARKASDSLTARLDELQARVREGEKRIEEYRREKQIVDANGRRVTDEQLVVVNSQLAGASSRIADARAKLEQIQSIGTSIAAAENLPEAINSPTLSILRQQLGDAERRAATLATTLGERHPDNIAARASLGDARRAITEELNRIRASAKAEYDRAVANEKTIVAQVEALKQETLATSSDAVRLRELQRELDANRSVYQAFLQRALETGEQEQIDATNARVITEAVPPLRKFGPNRRVIAVAGGVAGGAFAAALAMLLELLQKIKAHRRNEAAYDRYVQSVAGYTQPALPGQPPLPSLATRQQERTSTQQATLPPAPAPASWLETARLADALRQDAPPIGQSHPEPEPIHAQSVPEPDIEKPTRAEAYSELVRILRLVDQIENQIENRRNIRTGFAASQRHAAP
jgi:uncharacterized protein involved in exopolysaccharide biosynthesis